MKKHQQHEQPKKEDKKDKKGSTMTAMAWKNKTGSTMYKKRERWISNDSNPQKETPAIFVKSELVAMSFLEKQAIA